jgi:hypothetical protein
MLLKLNSRSFSLLNLNGILKTSFFLDLELHSVVTDLSVFLLFMTINNLWLNTNQIIDSEDWRSYLKKILREKPRNNWREKLKSLEEPKREKFWLLEKQKAEQILKRLKKLSLRRLLLHDCYNVQTNISYFCIYNLN